MFRSHRSIRPVVFVVAVATTFALSACTPNPAPTTTTTPRPTSASPMSTTPAPTTPSPSSTPTPVAIACDSLITLQQLYDFNPNFGVNPGYSPAAGSPAATAVAAKGVACSWMNQTSRETIDVSVAMPADDQLASLKETAGASTDAFGVDGYFAVTDGVGTAQVFANGYWVTASSVWFQQARDASTIVSDALGNLP